MWNHPGKPRSRTAAGPTTAKVTGTVTYRERIALSPEAVVGIKLIDVSRADAPAVTIGEQTIKDPGQVPVSFEIEYDPTAIDPRFTYAVRATITERGTLAFTSDTAYHVITRDNPTQVDMVLKRVASTPPATESSTPATVTGTVTYRERIALSPEAVVEIKLIDVSRADAPAVTIGEQTIKNPGQVPVSFEIEYDPTAIDPRFTYAVRATITERGTLAFTSDTAYHVITRDNPTQVDMFLKRVASTPPATESSTPATVTGTVTYRERIALSPDAVVEVKLVDVSRADAPAVTIGEQTIKNPGQVPIAFEIGYDPKTIDSRFTYAVQARIEERGTLMFINDTRYQVITRGNPAHVDMVLKRVGGSTPAGPKPPESPKNGMVAVPAPIESVDLSISSSNPPEYSLLIVSGLPGGCVEFEDHAINLVDQTFEVTVTNLGPAPGSMVICTAIYGYHESRIAIGDELEPREAYTIKVNGEVTTSFTAPDVRGPAMEEKTSPIARVDVKTSESDPAEYSLLVISRLPLGSNCSRFNGFDVSRRFAGTIDVAVTHLEATENDVPCTRDLPIVATRIPLGSEFKSGETYTVVINETVTETFVGR